MRTYLIDNENNEILIDITMMEKLPNGTKKLQAFINNEIHTVYFKLLANKVFYSYDQKTWAKTFKTSMSKNYFNGQDYYKVFRGFKPSGLFSGNDGNLITQMPGKVIKLLAKEGDTVKTGDTLMILEAMKMENEIKSSVDGIVKIIHVKKGQAVESGLLLMEIE